MYILTCSADFCVYSYGGMHGTTWNTTDLPRSRSELKALPKNKREVEKGGGGKDSRHKKVFFCYLSKLFLSVPVIIVGTGTAS